MKHLAGRIGLRFRIVLSVTAVFAAVNGLAGWVVLRRTESRLLASFDRQLAGRAGVLLAKVSVDPVVLPLPAEAERLHVAYHEAGRTNVLFQSPGFPASARASGYRFATVQSPVEADDEAYLSATLAVPDAALWQDLHALRWVFGLGLLGSLGLAFATGYVVSGWLLRPLRAIGRQAARIFSTDSIEEIPLPLARDELFDLTQTLNQMLARLKESAELQRNFFAAAAHELRTPLAVMKTGLEVTLGGLEKQPDTRDFLTGQVAEVNRLTRLLDEFLTISRPEDLPQKLEFQEVDVKTLLQTSADSLQTLTHDYGVTLRIEADPTTHFLVKTDAAKLRHVVLNLLENAVKYAPAGGEIRAEITQAEGLCTILVENPTARESGPTLDLLQPYFRGDPLREGHGLGLWIAHRLTLLLGGQLSLRWQEHRFEARLVILS